ncbi:MAG TPA: glycosyltransferase family 1 protein [Ktedonobacterales bacterium]|jgi:glycosyltransferase involved in cell wall biosynthesis
MRIAFNGLTLREPPSGTRQYAYHLLRALGRVDGVNDYLVLSPGEPRDVPETPDTFAWQSEPVGRLSRGGESVEKLVWGQYTFPAAARRGKARLLHVPHFGPPMVTYGIPCIVTIHDVIGLRLSSYRASPAIAAYGGLITRAARAAALILTVSEFSKRDIMEALGIPADRIRVVPEAAPPGFRRVVDAQRLRETRARYGLGERFVLYVGGLDQRKNVASLVGAFAAVYHEIGDPDLKLLIGGDPERLGSGPLFPDWRPLAATFGVADQVLCAPIPEEDLAPLYSATSCFVFPSLYEGFGLPPLEAMACGAPVVCSERTSLPEVVGSAGILINPEDPDALGAAIQRVLSSRDLRDDLRARALARARQFSWDQVAVETSAIYAEVAGTRLT